MPGTGARISAKRYLKRWRFGLKAMGWHPQDEDFTTPKRREKSVVRYQKTTDGMGRSKLRPTGMAL